MALKFLVTASHPVARFACDRAEFVVHEDIGETAEKRFYATAAAYGCSKGAPSPELAIRRMLAEHGCTVVRIEPATAERFAVVGPDSIVRSVHASQAAASRHARKLAAAERRRIGLDRLSHEHALRLGNDSLPRRSDSPVEVWRYAAAVEPGMNVARLSGLHCVSWWGNGRQDESGAVRIMPEPCDVTRGMTKSDIENCRASMAMAEPATAEPASSELAPMVTRDVTTEAGSFRAYLRNGEAVEIAQLGADGVEGLAYPVKYCDPFGAHYRAARLAETEPATAEPKPCEIEANPNPSHACCYPACGCAEPATAEPSPAARLRAEIADYSARRIQEILAGSREQIRRNRSAWHAVVAAVCRATLVRRSDHSSRLGG